MAVNIALDDYIKSNNNGRKGGFKTDRKDWKPPRKSAVWDRSGIDGKWSHDLYEKEPTTDSKNVKKFKTSRNLTVTKVIKSEEVHLRVSNMPLDLVESDVDEMFDCFNSVKNIMHFDNRGNFLGAADIYFNNSEDAVSTMEHYKKCEMDGAPLLLELVNDNGEVHEPVSVPITERLSFVGKKPQHGATKTILKKNYGAPQKAFFHRTARERKYDKPYNYNYLDRLADDQEYQADQKKKMELADLDRDLDKYMSKSKKAASVKMECD